MDDNTEDDFDKEFPIPHSYEQTKNFLVKSPEGAVLKAEQIFYNSKTEDSAMFIITVHQVGGNCACNLWSNLSGKFDRMMPERVMEDKKPNLLLVQGEVNRFVFKHGTEQIQEDLALDLGIGALARKVAKMIEESKQST